MNHVACFFDIEFYGLFTYLDINSLSILLANIFFHSVGHFLLFFFLVISFDMLLSLIKASSHLLILSFIFFASGAKSHPPQNVWFMSKRVLFSSCSFMVSRFTFRSLILFEFIFVVISVSNSVSNVLISFLYMYIFSSPKRTGHAVSP